MTPILKLVTNQSTAIGEYIAEGEPVDQYKLGPLTCIGVLVPVFSPHMFLPQATNLPKWLTGPAKAIADASTTKPNTLVFIDIKISQGTKCPS